MIQPITPSGADYIVNDGRTFKQNEPIVVHSPIISPFNITIPGETTAEVQTQAKQSDAVGAQLILDNDYSLNFKWQQYFAMKGYDMPAGWTKYVKTKYGSRSPWKSTGSIMTSSATI